MLGGDNHSVDTDRVVILVIFHGDLTLPVRAHVGDQAALADLCHLEAELLGQRQRQGHQLRRLIAGVAEHHTLIARAVVQLGFLVVFVFQRFVHAQGDVGGLLINGGNHAAGITVKAVFSPVIADLPDNLPGNLVNVHIAACGNLTHNVDQTGAGCGLAGDPALGVLGHDGIQHRVRYLIADFVRMSLGHRFRGEKIISGHNILLFAFHALPGRQSSALCQAAAKEAARFLSPRARVILPVEQQRETACFGSETRGK